MSDGALSQSEIDALLGGMNIDSGSDSAAGKPQGDENERTALSSFLSTTLQNQSSNFSTFLGSPVSLTGPELSFTTRDNLLEQLPNTVTVIKTDYSSGFPGEHSFIMGEDMAKNIASTMTHETDIQMDDMALSVIGEVISTMVGTQITALTNKTGNKSIASLSPETSNVPKAVAALPSGTFLVAVYTVDMGKGSPPQLWEIFGAGVSSAIAHALNAGSTAQAAKPAASGVTSGMQSMPNTGMTGGNMMGGMQGMGTQTNVQSVQFPNLTPRTIPQEQGNIGLIVDVYMEMTVELGRTKKLIKEILGMGEGTIIELDKLAGEPVDILVNHKLIAKGEVVVIDENFGVRVTEIVSPSERSSDLS
ncbi:MAG: flagellar motor switch protein FliN [Spirochaetaceae bacterium]|nr:flagellar motor switch protein FliN [Spirochaetaceae bacterium]